MSDSDDRHAAFFTAAPSTTIDVPDGPIQLPIRYYRTDCYLALFSADLDAVCSIMPTDRLQPVRVGRGRVAVGIMAYNYIETGVGPYGEIGVAVMCTLDRVARPYLPLLRESADPSFGAYVMHLPVTSRIARDAGRTVWGYPKFVADMAFTTCPERRQVDLAENGEQILSLEVRQTGRSTRDDKPLVTFTEHDGRLVRTTVATRAIHQLGIGKNHGHLELGDHPVARQLQNLDIAPDALATKNYLAHAAILPSGQDIGPCPPAGTRFAGTEARLGRHSIRYDDDVEVVVSEATGHDVSGSQTPLPLAVG